jgi:hypothetical protein
MGRSAMGREAGHPASYRFNGQLFAVVGSSYVPERHGDFLGEFLGEFGHDRGSLPAPAPVSSGRRWISFCALAALILFAANIGNIVQATARSPALAPISQPAGVAPSIAIFGGGEPIRW